MAQACAARYRARNPRATPLYRLFETHFDEVRGQWEERFERRCGFWRGFVDEQVRRYLDCGLSENGFARIRCSDCAEEYLLDRHPTATTFDGRVLCEDRAELELEEFARRLVPASGNSLEDLSSRRRGRELTRGRIEFATLAVGRYGLRVCDVAALLNKHPNSVTKWLNRGLRLERNEPEFSARLDQLDAAIS